MSDVDYSIEVIEEKAVIAPQQFNESDQLVEVIVGIADNMGDNLHPGFHAQKNNEKSTKNDEERGPSRKEKTIEQLAGLVAMLNNQGVIVHRPRPLSAESGNYNQVYPRDIGFALGELFIVSSMARRSRINEWRGIDNIIDRMPADNVVWAPEDTIVEGGDVVVDKEHVFVGLSQRTTLAGFDFVASLAIEQGLKPVAVPLKSLTSGYDILHLDCAFVPVGDEAALIFPEGMDSVPPEIIDAYGLLPITATEQDTLDTNMLTIGPSTVITRDSAHRINEVLSKAGLEVLPIPFDEPTKHGGNLRCCTLPLVRLVG